MRGRSPGCGRKSGEGVLDHTLDGRLSLKIKEVGSLKEKKGKER